MNKKVYIDFESRSQIDIWDTGAYRYAEDPTTEILCLCYAVDDGPIIGVTKGRELTEAVQYLNDLVLEGAEFHAHNAYFERVIWRFCLTPKYGAFPIPIEQWRCTAAKAATCALPRSLEKAALALGCIAKKDMEGNKLMKALSKTVGPVPKDKMQRLVEYCCRDVEVEREIDRKIPDLIPYEQRVWFMDQAINDLGVRVDTDAINKALPLIDNDKETLTKELFDLTKGEINAGTQSIAIKKYLERNGLELPNLRKQTLVAAIKKASPNNKRIIQLRQQLSLTSNAKYATMAKSASSDERIRDTLMYHGASTGRWSGKLVQLQNLIKSTISREEVDEAIDCLKTTPDAFPLFYDVLPTLSSCIRGMLIPTEGYDMFTADYAAVEARIVMWLADEKKGVKLFIEQNKNPDAVDVYVYMARSIYGKKDLTKDNKKERQLGKQTVLGCLSEDCVIYSDTGKVLLKDLKEGQKVWDGKKWVNFQQKVDVGMKNVIEIDSLELTHDHLVLTRRGWLTAGEIALLRHMAPQSMGQFLAPGRVLDQSLKKTKSAMSPCAVRAGLLKVAESTNFGEERLHDVLDVLRVSGAKKAADRVNILISSLMDGCGRDGQLAGITLIKDVKSRLTKTSTGMVLEVFPYPLTLVERSWNTLLHWMGMINGGSPWIELITTVGIKPGIYDSLLKERITKTKVKRCYDLINVESGLFQAGSWLVHNCGFGMGVAKFIDTCAKYNVEATDELAEKAVHTYRQTFSGVPRFWYALEAAAKKSVSQRAVVPCGKVIFRTDKTFMTIELPSGRKLYYYLPKVTKEGKLTFMSVNNTTNVFGLEETWGGKLAENVTQAVARDIMVNGMFNLRDNGYRILFTVHDELVVEGCSKNEQDVIDLVCRTPEWAKGCPIAAECDKIKRYRK